MVNVVEMSVSDVVFRDDLYPRIEKDPSLVQKYADNLGVLPPIEINQHNELIDGWHRWTAYKSEKKKIINVRVTKTKSDSEFLALACRRNATAGKQLSDRDKRKMCAVLYGTGDAMGKQEIAETLSVSLRAVNNWLHDTDKRLKEERDQQIFDMWLACYTYEEIAEVAGMGGKSGPKQVIDEKFKNGKCADSELFRDFQQQVYDIWNFGKSTNEVKHPGNVPPEILDNLLYYYTKPFDVVFDPFGGGGMTIDVCKKRLRRYFVSDLNPIEARKHEIRQHDITGGLPNMPVPNLVFLDPPYWKSGSVIFL